MPVSFDREVKINLADVVKIVGLIAAGLWYFHKQDVRMTVLEMKVDAVYQRSNSGGLPFGMGYRQLADSGR